MGALRNSAQAWAEDLIAREAFVLHRALMSCGRAVAFYDGDVMCYRSKINGAEVRAPVIELDSGHAHVVEDVSVFLELTPAAAQFFATMQQGLAALVAVAVRGAKANGVGLELSMDLLVAAVRAQLAGLEAAQGQVEPTEVMR